MLTNTVRRLHRRWQIQSDPVAYARAIGVTIGEDCRLIALNPATFGPGGILVKIGDGVTVSEGVRFITHDGAVCIFRKAFPDIELIGRIIIGTNVFIGAGSIILPDTMIGSNVVIGAGSVVTRDIPDNVVAAGNPARIIKTTEEYFEGIIPRAIHIRSLPRNKKVAMYRLHASEVRPNDPQTRGRDRITADEQRNVIRIE